MSGALEFTGERFVPGTRGEIWIEHWHRYHFAARWARGLRVLDVACGEGYGSALLARSAAQVTGVDVSGPAIAHARSAYAAMPNLAFEEASCTRLPLADASRDLVVSFETIEHIEAQEAFLDEVARVLAPGGLLLISSPNKLEYSDKRGFANEFHVKELYREELERLLRRHFPATAWYGQKPGFFSLIAPEGAPGEGALLEVAEQRPDEAASSLASPLYFVVVAAREAASLARAPAALSVFSDRDDFLYKDYFRVTREVVRAIEHRDQLAARVAELEAAHAQALAERDAAVRRVFEVEGFLAKRDDELVELRAALARSDLEVRRRGGLRWWLALPLRRLFGSRDGP